MPSRNDIYRSLELINLHVSDALEAMDKVWHEYLSMDGCPYTDGDGEELDHSINRWRKKITEELEGMESYVDNQIETLDAYNFVFGPDVEIEGEEEG